MRDRVYVRISARVRNNQVIADFGSEHLDAVARLLLEYAAVRPQDRARRVRSA